MGVLIRPTGKSGVTDLRRDLRSSPVPAVDEFSDDEDAGVNKRRTSSTRGFSLGVVLGAVATTHGVRVRSAEPGAHPLVSIWGTWRGRRLAAGPGTRSSPRPSGGSRRTSSAFPG